MKSAKPYLEYSIFSMQFLNWSPMFAFRGWTRKGVARSAMNNATLAQTPDHKEISKFLTSLTH